MIHKATQPATGFSKRACHPNEGEGHSVSGYAANLDVFFPLINL